MLMTARSVRPRPEYTAPPQVDAIWLRELVRSTNRPGDPKDIRLYYAGDLSLTSRYCVSVVGSRNASAEGFARARRLAKELVACGAVVVSGLAKGIDTAAHGSAIEHGGRTIAVIGTPLSRVTPVENSFLQESIWRDHLLVSPFPEDRPVSPRNFPERNRTMAALSDATVVVEASDTSGTLHQSAESLHLGRWLFILRTVAENPSVTWPQRFLRDKRTRVLDQTKQIFDALNGR
jgi:DNA processing protein